jgi:predicted nucleic acid-binding protein
MTSVSDPALVDTNVLVYALFPAMPDHAASRALLDKAKAAGANLCIAPQNLIEFFAVVTDPRRVTPAKTPDEALDAINDFLSQPGLALLPVPGDLIARWSQLKAA